MYAYLKKLNKTSVFVIGVLLLFVVLAAAATYYIHDKAYLDSINEANKTLFNVDAENAFVDMQGDKAELSNYRGKILIVNDWASWSPFAVEELPLLEKIAAEYTEKDVVVLAVNRMESSDQAQRFLNTLSPLSHVKIVIDTKDYFYGVSGGYAMPETLIYNEDGVLIEHIRGTLQFDTLHSKIEQLLRQ